MSSQVSSSSRSRDLQRRPRSRLPVRHRDRADRPGRPFSKGSSRGGGTSRGGRGLPGDTEVPCLSDHITSWRRVTQKQLVLDSVAGYRLDFVTLPPLIGLEQALTVSTRSPLITSMGEEIGALLRKGAIERVHGNTLGFYSFLFLVPKEKGGGTRSVINLKPLNNYIRKKPFRMTTLKEVGQSIRQGDWTITIDLQDAFLHVPVHKDYRRFLRFIWQGKTYQFNRLSFGLTSSPQVFTEITMPLVEYCRIRGIRVIFYLDDILVLASTRALLCQHRDFV